MGDDVPLAGRPEPRAGWTGRARAGLVWTFLFGGMFAGCSQHTVEQARLQPLPSADAALYSGTVTELLVFGDGRRQRASRSVRVTLRPIARGLTLNEYAAGGSVAGRAVFDASSRLKSFDVRDSSGDATSLEFSARESALEEFCANGLQYDRTLRSDGGYREIAKLASRNGTVVSTAIADSRGNGSWKVDVYPHAAETASTYYGFLNDAQMEYDLRMRTNGGLTEIAFDGGYAKGYDDPPALRTLGSVTTIPGADPVSGTLERIGVSATGDPSTLPRSIGITDAVVERYAAVLPRGAHGALESATLSESLSLQSPVRLVQRGQILAVLREDLRRKMRIALAPERAAILRRIVARH